MKATLKQGSDVPPSHLVLSGGIAKFSSWSADQKFLLNYAMDSDLQCLVEVRTGISPLFFDLDIVREAPIENAEILCWVRVIQNALKMLEIGNSHDEQCECLHTKLDPKFYRCRVHALHCLVLAAPARNVGEMGVKTGLHLIFPSFLIDGGTLPSLRRYAVTELTREFPSVDWDNIIDSAVCHPKASLRMVGSYKAKSCPSCGGGEKKRLCNLCYGSGKIPDVDLGCYHLAMSVNASGNTTDVWPREEDGIAHICYCASIRRFHVEATTIGRMDLLTTHRSKKSKAMTNSSSELVVNDDATLLGRISSFIVERHRLNVRVSKLLYEPSSILAIIAGPDSRKCGIANRVHSSQHIYFQFYERGNYRQRCFSPGCSKGGSMLSTIPRSVHFDLFPACQKVFDDELRDWKLGRLPVDYADRWIRNKESLPPRFTMDERGAQLLGVFLHQNRSYC